MLRARGDALGKALKQSIKLENKKRKKDDFLVFSSKSKYLGYKTLLRILGALFTSDRAAGQHQISRKKVALFCKLLVSSGNYKKKFFSIIFI